MKAGRDPHVAAATMIQVWSLDHVSPGAIATSAILVCFFAVLKLLCSKGMFRQDGVFPLIHACERLEMKPQSIGQKISTSTFST
jgi:hypothetical protein